MSATPQNNQDNQEIDLSQISKKIGDFFENISTSVFKVFLFFKRNILWVGILFVLGAALGFYMDKTTKLYDNQIIVAPNFGSADYLYAKVDLINSKIENNDTVFLRDVVGIKKTLNLKKISIQPIIDVYKFVENREKDNNFELLKLMAEDGDIKKIINDETTSKNYPFHEISFVTLNETTNQETVEPILKFLNDSKYYSVIQKQYIENIKIKMVENDSIISQINAILNSFSNTTNGTQKSEKLVYYNENSPLADVLKTKNDLIYEQGSRRLDLINLDKIIKDDSITLNIRNTKSVNGKMKLVLPVFFIALFVLVGFLKSYYRKQMAKLNS